MSKLRIRQVLEMVQAGICSVNEGMDLLEQPDLYTTPVKLGPEHGFAYGADHATGKDNTVFVITNVDTENKVITVLAMCSCGGTINVHQRTCPEYKVEEQQGEDFPAGMIDIYDWSNEYPEVKCECGAESIKSSTHSAWCPKHS